MFRCGSYVVLLVSLKWKSQGDGGYMTCRSNNQCVLVRHSDALLWLGAVCWEHLDSRYLWRWSWECPEWCHVMPFYGDLAYIVDVLQKHTYRHAHVATNTSMQCVYWDRERERKCVVQTSKLIGWGTSLHSSAALRHTCNTYKQTHTYSTYIRAVAGSLMN